MDRVTGVSIFVLGFALLLPLISQALSKHPRVFAVARYGILAVYVLANLYETLLFRVADPAMPIKLKPLWSYREALRVTGGLSITNPTLLYQILLNILLYVPLGYLLPFTWPRLREKPVSKKVVLIGFICSSLTELTQLIFHIGFFEFDDIMNNTLGCLAGYLLYELIQRRRWQK